ncbi:hypothetical protein BpHYR1_011802 [Brachionus plicatilis]|uniref:Uncharacterized protein n=1 Tax=Brachionus plicatilis TaxID=10195 RepID=A0A3M7T8Q0_BRAPC|nr:hypothetical protein BpHYR1_011802 [Brachionus plicatilis]
MVFNNFSSKRQQVIDILDANGLGFKIKFHPKLFSEHLTKQVFYYKISVDIKDDRIQVII